jgi:hypothetical protein
MSDIRFRGSAVAELAAVPGAKLQSQGAPLHCGVAMEWKTPDPVAMSAYSFDTGTEELPPVWRCSCGFQLDGVVHPLVAVAELSR